MIAPRRRYAGSARADHDNVGLARQRRGPGARAERRRRRKCRGRRQEIRGASLSCHGFRNFEKRENIWRTCRIHARAATVMVNQS